MEITTAAGNRLFQGVPTHVVERIAPLLGEIEVEANKVLFEEGEPAEDMYLIVSGMVRISRTDVTLAHLEQGDFFGEMALFDETLRSGQATAVMPTRLARVGADTFREMIGAAPVEIASNLTRTMMERMRAANEIRVESVLRAERLSLVGQMAGGIVHDLKNPIGVVIGSAEMLEQGLGTPDKLAGMLRRSADHMLGMVQDILDYTRGTWALELAPVQMQALIADLDEQALYGLERKGIHVERRIAFDGELLADARALVRALLNIIKNAGEAMNGTGRLTIAVEKRDDAVEFTIEDTGKGIEEAKLPTIFEPFVTHGKSGGTGFGMATTKAIVEAHGGRITVQSTVGEGTMFVLTIPDLGPVEKAQ